MMRRWILVLAILLAASSANAAWRFNSHTNKLDWGGIDDSSTSIITVSKDTTNAQARQLDGTANQITLTDNGAGNRLIVGTSQDIATTSTPQFARMGLGRAADGSVLLNVRGQAGISLDAYGTSAGQTSELRFRELLANGANYVGFKASDDMAANVMWSLPAADGSVGQLLSTGGDGILRWAAAGGSGTVTSVGIGGYLTGSTFTTSGIVSVDMTAIPGISRDNAFTATGITSFAGKVGIGTTSVGYTCSVVANTSNNTMEVKNLNSSGYALIQFSDNNGVNRGWTGYCNAGVGGTLGGTISTGGGAGTDVNYWANNAEVMRISTAKVGILTTSPNYTLDVRGNTQVKNLGVNVSPDAIAALTIKQQAAISLDPYGTSAGNTSEIWFKELTANGANYCGLKASDDIAANKVWALPAADGSVGQVLSAGGDQTTRWNSITGAIQVIMESPTEGAAIQAGTSADIEIPFACRITSATALADRSGSMVVDIWKDTYANFPPTVADSICTGAKLTVASATSSRDTTLAGWTTLVNSGDILTVSVDTATTVHKVTISLGYTRY